MHKSLREVHLTRCSSFFVIANLCLIRLDLVDPNRMFGFG